MKELYQHLAENQQLFENERQASIYLALLRDGNLGAEKISQSTGLHRETVQRELKKMANFGTVNFKLKGKNKEAEAVPISQLQEMIQMQVQSFDKLLKPLLQVEANKKLPQIQILTGNHAYGIIQMKLLRQMPDGETMRAISNQGKNWREAMVEAKKLSQFETLRLDKKVKLQLSCFEESRGEIEYNNREYFAGQPNELKRTYRYIQTEETSPLMIQMWFNSILISSFLSTPSIHILIEDKNLRNSMSAYFSVLWSLGKP